MPYGKNDELRLVAASQNSNRVASSNAVAGNITPTRAAVCSDEKTSEVFAKHSRRSKGAETSEVLKADLRGLGDLGGLISHSIGPAVEREH